MSHWIDCGQPFKLHQIQLDQLHHDGANNYQLSDNRLAKCLQSLQQNPGVLQILLLITHVSLWMPKNEDLTLQFYPSRLNFSNSSSSPPLTGPQYNFSKLLSAADSKEPILWGPDLCPQFHMLIIVTTIAYTHQLEQLAQEYRANKREKIYDRIT